MIQNIMNAIQNLWFNIQPWTKINKYVFKLSLQNIFTNIYFGKLFIEMPVGSQDSKPSCTCLWGMDFVCFYSSSIEFYNCSDSVVFFVFRFIQSVSIFVSTIILLDFGTVSTVLYSWFFSLLQYKPIWNIPEAKIKKPKNHMLYNLYKLGDSRCINNTTWDGISNFVSKCR